MQGETGLLVNPLEQAKHAGKMVRLQHSSLRPEVRAVYDVAQLAFRYQMLIFYTALGQAHFHSGTIMDSGQTQ